MTSVHPAAVVDPGAELGAGVEIGPFCVGGPNAKIGDGARLMSHVVIDGYTTIGAECTLFPFACIGTQTQDLKFRGAKTSVTIGDKTTLREYVTVNSSTNEGEVTWVGSGCHIMAYAHIAHACSVGNGVIMANCATLAGDVTVEDKAIVGGLTAIHQFVRVGRHCILGGCSRITQDCPPFMMVAGNPAAVGGINSVGLKRNNFSEDVQRELKRAYKILYRSGLNVTQALAKIEEEVEPCEEIVALVSFIRESMRGVIR